MGGPSRFLFGLLLAADRHPAPNALKVALGSAALVGLAAYLVLGRPAKKAGHDLASSEKPQALRGERTRTLEGEKAALSELRAAAARKAAAPPLAPAPP